MPNFPFDTSLPAMNDDPAEREDEGDMPGPAGYLRRLAAMMIDMTALIISAFIIFSLLAFVTKGRISSSYSFRTVQECTQRTDARQTILAYFAENGTGFGDAAPASWAGADGVFVCLRQPFGFPTQIFWSALFVVPLPDDPLMEPAIEMNEAPAGWLPRPDSGRLSTLTLRSGGRLYRNELYTLPAPPGNGDAPASQQAGPGPVSGQAPGPVSRPLPGPLPLADAETAVESEGQAQVAVLPTDQLYAQNPMRFDVTWIIWPLALFIFAAFESSALRSTPGMAALRIMTANATDGGPVGFRSALQRYIVISCIILAILVMTNVAAIAIMRLVAPAPPLVTLVGIPGGAILCAIVTFSWSFIFRRKGDPAPLQDRIAKIRLVMRR